MLPDMISTLQATFLTTLRVGQLRKNHCHNLYHNRIPHTPQIKKPNPAIPTDAAISGEAGTISRVYDAKPPKINVTTIDAIPMVRSIAIVL